MGCARGDDNAGVEHLRSLAADDPAREQFFGGQIVAALRKDRTPGQQPNNDGSDMAPCLPIAGPKIAQAPLEEDRAAHALDRERSKR